MHVARKQGSVLYTSLEWSAHHNFVGSHLQGAKKTAFLMASAFWKLWASVYYSTNVISCSCSQFCLAGNISFSVCPNPTEDKPMHLSEICQGNDGSHSFAHASRTRHELPSSTSKTTPSHIKTLTTETMKKAPSVYVITFTLLHNGCWYTITLRDIKRGLQHLLNIVGLCCHVCLSYILHFYTQQRTQNNTQRLAGLVFSLTFCNSSPLCVMLLSSDKF